MTNATETALAIDCSNYSGELSAQQASDLYAAGVRKAIVQMVNERVLTHRQQIPVLLAAGIEVEGYVYVWFGTEPGSAEWAAQRVGWACDELAKFPGATRRMWLDCEQSDHDTPPFDYVHAPTSPTIRACVAAVRDRGFDPGIYTAAWWWIPGVSNSTEFCDLPLWNANYDLDPDLDEVNFGGWTVPRMEQFKGSTSLARVPMVDLNSFAAAAAAPPAAVLSAADRVIDEIHEMTSVAIAARKGA